MKNTNPSAIVIVELIRTPRLYLRTLTEGDAADLFAIYSDPIAMEHYPSTRTMEETVSHRIVGQNDGTARVRKKRNPKRAANVDTTVELPAEVLDDGDAGTTLLASAAQGDFHRLGESPGVSDDGDLIVATDSGLQHLQSGEAQLVRRSETKGRR